MVPDLLKGKSIIKKITYIQSEKYAKNKESF